MNNKDVPPLFAIIFFFVVIGIIFIIFDDTDYSEEDKAYWHRKSTQERSNGKKYYDKYKSSQNQCFELIETNRPIYNIYDYTN